MPSWSDLTGNHRAFCDCDVDLSGGDTISDNVVWKIAHLDCCFKFTNNGCAPPVDDQIDIGNISLGTRINIAQCDRPLRYSSYLLRGAQVGIGSKKTTKVAVARPCRQPTLCWTRTD